MAAAAGNNKAPRCMLAVSPAKDAMLRKGRTACNRRGAIGGRLQSHGTTSNSERCDSGSAGFARWL